MSSFCTQKLLTVFHRIECPRFLDQARPIDGRPITQVEVDGTLLDVEASYCYLGDMLSAGGGCALAIATRCSTAWGKFRKLLPILTSKHVPPLTRGKVLASAQPYYMEVKLGPQQPWIYRRFLEMIEP